MFGRYICLLRPATIILISTDWVEPPVDGEFDVPPQALRATMVPTAANALRLSPCIARFSSLNRNFAAELPGSPLDEPVLDRRENAFRHQGHDGEQEHAGKDPVDVEGVLSVVDQLPNPGGRSEELADDGADNGQAEADMQARQNPGERRREDDRGRQPAVVR